MGRKANDDDGSGSPTGPHADHPSDIHSIDSESGRGDASSDGVGGTSQAQLAAQPIRTWRGYLWDTWELPPDQRKLLFKVDAFVLTFSSIGYFLKNLDLNNVNNAFLSGMKEDLGMWGNELVTSTCLLCLASSTYTLFCVTNESSIF